MYLILFSQNFLLRLLIMLPLSTMPVWWFARKGWIKFSTAHVANISVVIVLSLGFNMFNILTTSGVVRLLKSEADVVTAYVPDARVHGGEITVMNQMGTEKTFHISEMAENRTRYLTYPRDAFMRRGPNLDFMIWYRDGKNIEDGHLVVHHVT